MLADQDTSLEKIVDKIQSITALEEWEQKVLGAAAIIGFPHEETTYTLKTTNDSALELLCDLAQSTSDMIPRP